MMMRGLVLSIGFSFRNCNTTFCSLFFNTEFNNQLNTVSSDDGILGEGLEVWKYNMATTTSVSV